MLKKSGLRCSSFQGNGETRILLPVYTDCIVILVQNYWLLVRSQEGAGQMDFTQTAGRGQKGTRIAIGVVQCGGELTPCTVCSILFFCLFFKPNGPLLQFVGLAY